MRGLGQSASKVASARMTASVRLQECGGSRIAPHGRQLSYGRMQISGIVPHGRQRSECKDSLYSQQYQLKQRLPVMDSGTHPTLYIELDRPGAAHQITTVLTRCGGSWSQSDRKSIIFVTTVMIPRGPLEHE